MKDALYHALVGNDAHPALVAFARGMLEAVIVGALAFLAMWSETNDAKILAIAGLTPFLLVLLARFVSEGALDTWKARNGS
jgi:hypothetical protein